MYLEVVSTDTFPDHANKHLLMTFNVLTTNKNKAKNYFKKTSDAGNFLFRDIKKNSFFKIKKIRGG